MRPLTAVDIADGSIITVKVRARNSTLIIMFSTEAMNPSATDRIQLRAIVDGSPANPPTTDGVYFTPDDVTTYGVYGYNFYDSTVAGSHIIKIQWRVTGGTGCVYYRTLIVIALPA